MKHTQPQTRQIRAPEQAQNRPQPQPVHVREQSSSAFSPRHQARQQTVRVRDDATISVGCHEAATAETTCPQTDRSPELSTSTASFLNNIGREPEQAKKCPSRRITVSMSPPTSFPVHIRNIPAHVLI
jgi:hypothetical protein